jgi:integrase
MQRQEEYKQILGNDYEKTGYVYAHDNGNPYRVNSVTEQFKAFLEAHNLPKIRLHDLRHTLQVYCMKKVWT